MKFRRNKIKREHSIIDGALDWLEDLSKHREISDIIPGVINITNSRERGATYQYETPTGCKILLKNGGSIQEAFVVTEKPQVVKDWASKITQELDFFRAALEDTVRVTAAAKEIDRTENTTPGPKNVSFKKNARTKASQIQNAHNSQGSNTEANLSSRDSLLSGIKEDYQLVEINQGLRDSLVDSLATMADSDDPKLEEVIDPDLRKALEKLVMHNE